MIKDKLLKVAKWLWIIAVVVFVGIYFYQHLPEEIAYLKSIRISNLLLAALFLCISKIFLSELARESLFITDWHPSFAQMFAIVNISQLGKYIPGGIWHFAARISSYKENRLTNSQTARVMILENLWLVSGAFFMGILLLAIRPPVEYVYLLTKWMVPDFVWIVLRVVLPVLWVICLLVIDQIFSPQKPWQAIKHTTKLLLIQIGIWATLGFSFFFIFQNIGVSNLFVIMGGYAISWVAGYLVIFAPGGIGVREFVLVKLFSSMLASTQIVIYSIIHRLIYTLIEVIMGVTGIFVQRRAKRLRTADTPIPEEGK